MHDVLSMRSSNTQSYCTNQFQRSLRLHRTFCTEKILKRLAFHEFHNEEWHRATDHSEVGYSDDVLVFDRSGGKRFLAKTGCEVRVVAHEIGKNDFDRVRSFKKDMTCLKHYPH